MKFASKLRALAFAAATATVLTPAISHAALGDNVYASGGTITIRFEGSDAGYDSNLQLWVDGVAITPLLFPNHTTAVGTTFEIPDTFAAGTLLDIQLHVANTGDVWHTGSGSNNADSIAHANVIYNYQGETGRTFVGFEDLYGGGDQDYNDHMFSFTNTAAVVPEPESYALLLAGLGLVAGIARRKSTKTA